MDLVFVENAPASNNSGWTNSDNAHADDTAYAYTTNTGTTVQYYGIDLSTMPVDRNIVGIRVRVDATWSDPGGSDISLPKIGVALSSTGGSIWTTEKQSYVMAKNATRSYWYGGPLDTWGRSWTHADTTHTTDFRIRIRSLGTQVGSPEWRVEFVQIAVYYTEDGFVKETLMLTDESGQSESQVTVYEPLLHFTEKYEPAGTAVSEYSSSTLSTFEDAARNQNIEGSVVQLFMSPTTFFWIGDAAVASVGYVSGDPVVSYCQPGLMSIDGITYTGNFGQKSDAATATITMANRSYSLYDGTLKTLPEFARTLPLIGNQCRIYALVKGDAWYKYVVFEGVVSSMETNGDEVMITAIQSGHDLTPVPGKVVEESSFYYKENTYSGNPGNEGNKIPDAIGKVVPIGIGRFDITAVDASWADGHVCTGMEIDGVTPVASKDAAAAPGIIPAMLGHKHPMMPTVAACKNWIQYNDAAEVVSPIYQTVYLFGDKSGTVPLYIGYTDFDDPKAMTYGRVNQDVVLRNGGSYQAHQMGASLLTVFTWIKQESYGIDAGSPFVRDWSDLSSYYSQEQWNMLAAFGSAGSMWGAINGSQFPRWTFGTAKETFGVFVNSHLEDLHGRRFPHHSLALQAMAVPFEGLSKSGLGGGNKTWLTSGTVADSLNAKDTKNLDTKTRITEGGQLCYQAPTKFQSPGELWGIRIGTIYNPVDSTGVLRMNGRLWPNYPATCVMESGTYPRFPHDLQHPSTNISSYAESIGSGTSIINFARLQPLVVSSKEHPYCAWWFVEPWDYNANIQQADGQFGQKSIKVSGSDGSNIVQIASWQGMAAQDEFMSWGSVAAGNFALAQMKWPWDCMWYVHDLGGSTYVDINAVWLEVIYKTRVADVPGPPNTQKSLWSVPPGQRARFDSSELAQEAYAGPWFRAGKRVRETMRDESSFSDIFITGLSSPFAEYPSDVIELLIRKYNGGQYAGRATGTDTFGSFDDALSTHGTARMTLVVDRQETFGEVVGRIAEQTFSLVQEQLDDSGSLEYRMFVDSADPATADPARLYKTNGYYFMPLDIEEIRVETSDSTEISNNVKVKYGYHIPSGSWSAEKYVNRLGTNFSTDAAVYQAAANASFTAYNLENPKTYECPDIWDPTVAEVVAKWYFCAAYKRRVNVEFTTFVKHVSLRVGHVIRFHDDLANNVKYPGETGSASWSSHQFNVVGVSYSKDSDGFWRVKVLAQETYTVPS